MGIKKALFVMFVVSCICIQVFSFHEIYASDITREECLNQSNCFLPDDANEGKVAISMYDGNPYARAKATLNHIIRVPWKITRKKDGYWWKWSDYTLIEYQGNVGYCTEPSVIIKASANYSPIAFDSILSEGVRNLMTLYMIYGYTYPNHKTDKYYLAAQKLIWEAIGGYTIKFYDMNSNFTGNLDLTKETSEIKRLVENHGKKPSFHQSHINLKVGESVTITDTAGVVQDYAIKSVPDYLKVKKSGNDVVITAMAKGNGDDVQLQHGSDQVENVMIQGYKASGSQTFVTIPEGSVAPLVTSISVDVSGFGDLLLQKQNQQGVNQGAGFTFAFSYQKDMSDPIGVYTTDTNGQIVLKGLDEGVVYYQELSVPENASYAYVLDSSIQAVQVVADTMTQVKVKNIQKGHFDLVKMDSATLERIGGVRFLISENKDMSNPLGIYTTNEDGEIHIPNLMAKTYYYQEVHTVSPYVLDATIHTVKVEAGKTTTIQAYNDRQVAKVTIVKKDKETGKMAQGYATLKGAEFDLLADDQKRVIRHIVSEDDTVIIEDLPLGTYYLKETKAPAGMYMNNELVKMTFCYSDQNQKVNSYYVDVYDTVSKTEILKVDGTNGEALAGAILQIVDSHGNRIEQWESSLDSHVIKGLTVNEKYLLKEVMAPYGFSLASDVEFTVNEGKSTQVTMVNELKKIPFRLVKRNAITHEVVIHKDFQFTLYHDEECLQMIQTMSADTEKGYVECELNYGTYFMKETKAPDGYIVSEEVVQVDYNDLGVFVNGNLYDAVDGIYSYSYYDMPLPSLRITKKDRETGSVPQGYATLQGAKYDLYAADKKTVIQHIAFTDDYVLIEELPLGTYYLKETLAPQGMQISPEFIEVVLSYDQRMNTNVFEKEVFDEVTIVEISKKNEDGQMLEGAHLQVVDNMGMVIEEWVSTTQPHILKGLVVGETYLLKEIQAPVGYQLSNDVSFLVLDGTPTKVGMIDAPKEIKIHIDKMDALTEEIIRNQEAVFGLYLDEECNHELMSSVTCEGSVDFVLRYGIYYLKEMEAPQGYVLSTDVVKIQYGDEGLFVDDEQVECIDDAYAIRFYNKRVPIVDTADINGIIQMCWIGVGVLSLLILAVLYVKRNNSKWK